MPYTQRPSGIWEKEVSHGNPIVIRSNSSHGTKVQNLTIVLEIDIEFVKKPMDDLEKRYSL